MKYVIIPFDKNLLSYILDEFYDLGSYEQKPKLIGTAIGSGHTGYSNQPGQV